MKKINWFNTSASNNTITKWNKKENKTLFSAGLQAALEEQGLAKQKGLKALITMIN